MIYFLIHQQNAERILLKSFVGMHLAKVQKIPEKTNKLLFDTTSINNLE